MSINKSIFSNTISIYENCKSFSLIKHEIQFPLAERVIQLSSRIFQMLDRADPVQSEISRRLWVLKSSILFTVLPFADPALRLQAQVKELEQSLECLPSTKFLVESLREAIFDIVAFGENPKRNWLIRMHSGDMREEVDLIGILIGLSAGRSPGWSQEISKTLAELSSRLMPIKSKKDLRSNLFKTIILPCSCSNAPPSILSELFFAGLANKLEVLLYPGEIFRPPTRLVLPSDHIFSAHLQRSKMELEVVSVKADQVSSVVDTWINEAFWQGLHGAERQAQQDLYPAKYMLFSDGTGSFFPEDGRVMTLPADCKLADEGDLCMVRIEDVCEGDMVVMRSGDSGILVDEASERILGHEDNENLFDMATDWKDALDALLVTHTSEEVAVALRERGSSASATSIQKWVGPDVLGPRNEHVFRELVYLLAEKGKIQKTGSELTSYVDTCWKHLQDVRSLHQKAGSLIRHDLFKALFSRFGNEYGGATLSDRESIRLDGNTKAQLLILRVAAVDNSVAYVQPSRLGKIDDLVGNKWLG
jgi:5-carboxymethyl-2-hydroxymuconate isomerase